MPRARLGLPRTRRLRRPAEYNAVRRGKLKTRDPLFIVNASQSGEEARIGIAVSRKVSTRAVVRNRIKRQIRESFRHHQAMLHGFDIVVIAQTGAANAGTVALAQSLAAHWQRLVSECSRS